MPIYKAHGGLTALSHDQEQYPVTGGWVELPGNETWYHDLVACGQLELATAKPTEIVIPTPEPEEAPAWAGPALEAVVAASIETPEPAAPAELPAPEPRTVEMFTAPADPAPARNVRRRGGKG